MGINKQDASDRKASGGNLTNNQKQTLNKQLNKTSSDIAKDRTVKTRQ